MRRAQGRDLPLLGADVLQGRAVGAKPVRHELFDWAMRLQELPEELQGCSLEAVEYATLEWVDWFNKRRLLEPVENIPPAEAEANFYAALANPAMAA